MLKSCFLKVPSLYKSILKYVYFSFWRRVEFEDWTWKTVYMFSFVWQRKDDYRLILRFWEEHERKCRILQTTNNEFVTELTFKLYETEK
jgi:nuclear transport factor 2 (NTF2) superfamily protein